MTVGKSDNRTVFGYTNLMLPEYDFPACLSRLRHNMARDSDDNPPFF